MSESPPATDADTGTPLQGEALSSAYKAVSTLFHAYLTGLILTTVTRRNKDDAAELMFRTFRRQHLEKFLPGLKLLGLDDLPHAVACAQYHYLSNHLGGVKVEYMYESERKAWVRYLPPRWIFHGTAICGIPTEASRAMLRGWHAHNGVSLGNPRLGFVCTKQTVDGQYGLEGYYYEYDHDLEPEERLRFAPGEEGPDFDPAAAPHMEGGDWPEERFRKIERNYAMEYVRSVLPEMAALFGEEEARHLGGLTGRLIGMQYYDEVAGYLGIAGSQPEGFALLMCRFGEAQGDPVAWEQTGDAVTIRQQGVRLFRGLEPLSPAVIDAWQGLWEGLLAVHNRHLRLDLRERMDRGDGQFLWRLRTAGPAYQS